MMCKQGSLFAALYPLPISLAHIRTPKLLHPGEPRSPRQLLKQANKQQSKGEIETQVG